MDLRGRKSLVLGAGRSGVEAAKFLSDRGAVVALHDRLELEQWSEPARSLKTSHGIGLISGQLPSWLLDQIDLVVISPGVPTNSIPARYVDRKDGVVIGEVELAYRFLKGRIVGITGSNGKTTTTTLIGKLLAQGGLQSQVGGNIGNPLLSLVPSSSEQGWTVVELSSFQLETIKEFRANVALCLNVTPNHLDRYDSFQDYAAAKYRIFLNQTPADFAILNADDEVTKTWANGLRARVIWFSVRRELDEGIFLRGDKLINRSDGVETVLMSRENIPLKGTHNVENVLAALAAGSACGVSLDSMQEAVQNFTGVEHRMEFVTRIDGVNFYNDSKATSVDATVKALSALEGESGKTVLILGGRGKRAPYDPLAGLIERSVRTLIVIGEDGDNIASQLSGTAEIQRAETMDEAVRKAFSVARPGDSVLLAPACASFDMFKSFEERGTVFKNAVSQLMSQAGAA